MRLTITQKVLLKALQDQIEEIITQDSNTNHSNENVSSKAEENVRIEVDNFFKLTSDFKTVIGN